MPTLNRLDENTLQVDREEILGFSCVRNERLRLPFFLKYHRDLGVNRFLIVDNQSDDGTVAYLLKQKDVHLFQTAESYASSNMGVNWLNQLLDEYAEGHWSLVLDADEILVYPLCESVDLRSFTKYLESNNEQGLLTFLLDMYADSQIKDTHYVEGTPFIDTCSFFDIDTYSFSENERYKNIAERGGVRERLFWDGKGKDKPSPFLPKIPLVKWQKAFYYKASTHVIDNVKLATIRGVLQHFKMFSDFISYSKKETERKEHWDNAFQYKTYWDVLNESPTINPVYDGSVKYIDSIQLVNLGLIQMPDDYIKIIKERPENYN